MKPVLRFKGVLSMMLFTIVLFSASVYSGLNPTRVDFFDNANNPISFIVFNYNEAGALTGRTMYMADSTFKREVDLVTNPTTGARVAETSRDFNGDTSFVTKYESDGLSFSIRDQFQLDHVGGVVNVAATDPLNYSLTYQVGGFASRMKYEYDASGNLKRVDVFNEQGVMEYFGVFSSVGVNKTVSARIGGAPQAVITSRGSAAIDVRFNLSEPGIVKCELLTLSGRVAGVLMNENVPKGHFLRSIKTGRNIKASSGVYLFVVSVNGRVVSSSRFLADVAVKGGVQ